MASLDDLKGQNKSPVKKPFIPQVSSPTDPTATKQRGKMPVSMTVLSSIPDSSEEKTPKRQSLDLSSIPNPENTGGLEVKTYNSIEDQIFGEGGPFDKYKEEFFYGRYAFGRYRSELFLFSSDTYVAIFRSGI